MPLLTFAGDARPAADPAEGESSEKTIDALAFEDLLNVPIIAATRRAQRNFESARFVSILTAADLSRRNYRTLPDALQDLAGVMVQHTNYGGGAPIVRGQIGNRILILVDGVRLNNTIYRLGPNQYLNTIDLHSVERIEVLHGPGSVLYGSDALGGIIHIITKKLRSGNRAASNGAGGNGLGAVYQGRFATADTSAVGNLAVTAQYGRMAVHGSGTLRNYNNLRPGGGLGPQNFTGYGESDGMLKLQLDVGQSGVLELLSQRVVQNGVDRSDVLLRGTDLRQEWMPLRRDLTMLRYESGQWNKPWARKFADNLQVVGSFQRMRELVYRIPAVTPNLQQSLQDDVRTEGLQLQLLRHVGERMTLTYGLDFFADQLDSQRADTNLLTGIRTSTLGNFADGSRQSNIALFAQNEWQVLPRLQVVFGGRWTRIGLHAKPFNAQTGVIAVDSITSKPTGSVNFSFALQKEWSLIGGVSQGFRSPNADDATVLREFGSGLEIPNATLTPERSLNYETGIKHQSKRVSNTASFYWSNYAGLIGRQPATLLGLPYLDLNRNGLRDAKEPLLFQRQNGGLARVRGFLVQNRVRLSQAWSLESDLATTYGEDLTARTPLTRIPPIKAVALLRYNPSQHWYLEQYAIASGRQNRLSASDRADLRILPTGTPGFATLNVRFGLEVTRHGFFTLGLENLTNKNYRWHGSGIAAAGRNVVIGLQILL